MENILIPTFISVAAIYIVLWQIDIHKVLGYHVLFDISFTVILASIYAGSYAGVLTAMATGLGLSIVLLITKWLIGYKRIVGWKGIKPVWKYFEG